MTTEENVIDNDSIKEFPYLGSINNQDGRNTSEIKNKIILTKRVFYGEKQLLMSNVKSRETKTNFIQMYIWSTHSSLWMSELNHWESVKKDTRVI